MNIIIVAPHQWPLPSPAHTGVVVILDLAISLSELGNSVQLCAPHPSDFPNVLPMPCSNGSATPSAAECELTALRDHRAAFDAADIIHDFSVEKHIAAAYPDKSISTPLSGNDFDHPAHGRNFVCWSEEMRGRSLRGASDYEGTEFSQWLRNSRPLKDSHVVHGGCDTSFYCPFQASYGDHPAEWGFPKDGHMLWLGRWHTARGFTLAIDAARLGGFELVMAGEHIDYLTQPFERDCLMSAIERARGLPNVHFEFLPPDPNHHTAKREMYRRAAGYMMLPLLREPFGLSQIEAMACGTPVIGTNMGSVPEVVEHGVTGWIADTTADDVARAVAHVSRIDPARCRKEAVRRFDRSVMAANYVRAYEECLAGGWGQ